MDKLTSINVFRQVVESGSFVGAADRLDLSTAMVSKHVMAIEKCLGVRLLNRNSHKLSLTEPGKFYLERCKAILQDLQKTELELESLSSAPRGTLRIAFCDTCIPGLGLASVLAEYRRRWPEVVVDISFVDRAVDLVEEHYDLAFRLVHDESLPAGVVARRVRSVPFRLAASRAYLECNGIPKVPEDLGRHDFITAGGPESLSLESAHGTVEIPLRVALRCRTMADVAVTVAGGMGLALLPATLLNDPAFVNVLRPVLTEFRLKEFNLYLLYPGRKFLPFKSRAFIDLVLESTAKSQEQKQPGLAANRRHPMAEEPVVALAV
jgi:DNA-binding transcriptional LysR family regulator